MGYTDSYDASVDPLLGSTVGSYRFERRLGVGGMGEVYLGVHPMIGSRVAIKVLSQDAAARPELVQRFFAEARAAAAIRHENIVNVIDLVALADGRPCIIMELLDGAPLSGCIEGIGPLPLGALATVMSEVLAAIGAAHATGIVHRDLKPDNVFVTPGGHGKVLDFGIAKLLPNYGHVDGSTKTGALLGTPHYMAPEQIESRDVDLRADIYSIGVILFEAATGRRPFDADSLFALLQRHVMEAPPSPRELRPSMPVAYEAVILRALAKDPAQRFASADEMRDALAAAAAELPEAEWSTIVPTDAGVSVGPPSSQRRSGSPGVSPVAYAPTAQASQFAPPTEPEIRAAPQGSKRKAMVIGGGLALVGGVVAVVALMAGADPTAAPQAGEGAGRTATSGAGSGPSVTSTNGVTKIQTGGKARLLKADFDSKAFDANAYVPKALAHARAVYSDAVLVEFDISGVRPDGLADLTVSKTLEGNFWFRSPSRSARPKNLPKGIEADIRCMVYVEVHAGQVEIYTATREECTDPARPMPRCSLKHVWTKAAADGAPSANTVAKISYLSDGWFLSIGTNTWSGSIKDDC